MTTNEYVTPPRGIKLKWKGMLDLDLLYKEIKRWLEDKGFFKEQTSEKKYTERKYPGGIKNVYINWKNENKVSDYFRYHIDVDFLLLGISDVELQLPDGNKKKVQKGDFEIKIMAYVQTGSEEWDKMKALEKMYYNLIIRRRLEAYQRDLYDKTYKFQVMIKDFFIKGEFAEGG
ncbi:MAG: hypothetical protein KKG60_00960 [Nanoarchaeota archaeon]|nr:hypothetical protein [Nanoarchaeota archaeon]